MVSSEFHRDELAPRRASADIGVTGLAVMGHNLARHGQAVAVHNRSPQRTRALVREHGHGHEGEFVPAESLKDFVTPLKRPRAVIVMVQAGAATDAVIDELVPLLHDGDIVVDCGNAHFTDTRRRAAALAQHGLHFVGCGVSGGEEGALNGPSIMPGGSAHAWTRPAPIRTSIAAEVEREPCVVHAGPDGAGHFVKMVHNGIEYAGMQLIAEAYDLLRLGLKAPAHEIAEVFKTWNKGDLESFLVETTADVLARIDPDSGKDFVDVVLDQAEQKGTGRLTVRSALDLGVPITGIAEATFARSLSGHADQRGPARTAFGTDIGELNIGDRDTFVEDVRKALYASKVVAYAQGFDQIKAGCEAFGWNVDRGAMASIWRGGCIIRARFLDRVRQAYDADPELPSLLVAPYFADAIKGGVAAGGVSSRPGGRADPGVLLITRLLRRAARRATAGRAHPGPARQLRRAQRALALTLPGLSYDGSPAGLQLADAVDYVAGAVERRNLSDVVLACHSWGGYPATGAAHRLMGRVTKVIYFSAVVPERGTPMLDENEQYGEMIRQAIKATPMPPSHSTSTRFKVCSCPETPRHFRNS